MNSTKKKVALLASTATLAAGGVVAATAQAETVDVIGGETELSLNKKTATALEDLGVTAEGTVYEVKGGEFDYAPIDEGGGGVLEHKGSLTLETEDVKVKLKSFQIDLFGADETERAKDDDGVLTAKIGGDRVEVGRLNTKKYDSDEKEYSFTGLKVALTKEAAKALNKGFDVDAFEEGIKLGVLENQSEVK